jgi:hypothetical protein
VFFIWRIISTLENTCMQKPSPCWQNYYVFQTWSIVMVTR